MEQHDRWVEAAVAALAPYPWRRCTAELVARCVAGAVDGARGTGGAGPAGRDDPRVEALTQALAGTAWRSLTASALCRRVVEALVAWEVRDQCLDLELRWLLEGSGWG